jgi:ankyrin repeat protein
MTAAYKNQFEIVKVLLDRSASINTVDLRNRTVLHNVAADLGDEKGKAKTPQKGQSKAAEKAQAKSSANEQPKPPEKARSRCSMTIVEYLIGKGVDVEAKDALGRTALHWTCVANNEALLRTLLGSESSTSSPRAQVNCVDGRMKTPLHLAVSHKRIALAQILLERGALINPRSDGGWTPLHNACIQDKKDKPKTQETQEERERRESQEDQDRQDRTSLVQLLLKFKADANAELINGRTPLHVAAETGHVEAARCLLDQPRIRRAVKDRFGNTPLLIAAQHGKKNIVEMLAPWNHMSLLSEEEIQAAKQFDATIVDFGNFR